MSCPDEQKLWLQTLKLIDLSFANKKPDAHEIAQREIDRLRKFLCVSSRSDEAIEKLKQLQVLVTKHKKKILLENDEGPTVLASLKRRSDSIHSLETSGVISVPHAVLAREMRSVYEAAIVSLQPKCCTLFRMDKGISGTSERATELAEWFFTRYGAWCSALGHGDQNDRKAMRIARLVILDGHSLDSARKVASCGYDTAAKLIRIALERYSEFCRTKESFHSPHPPA